VRRSSAASEHIGAHLGDLESGKRGASGSAGDLRCRDCWLEVRA
jgi:hypothetical protein